MKDERIVSVQREAQAGGFAILAWGMMLVLIYRQYYLNQSFEAFGDFVVLWVVALGYTAIRTVLGGVNPSPENPRRSRWRTSAMIGVVIMGAQIYNNAVDGIGFSAPIAWIAALLTFLVGFALAYVGQGALQLLYRLWEERNL